MYISNLALEKVPKKFDRGIRFIGCGPGSRLRFYTTASSAAVPVSEPARLTRFISRLGWSDSGFTFTLWWKASCASACVVCSLGAWPGPLSFRFGFTFTLWWVALGASARVVGSLGAWPGPPSFRFTFTLWWVALGAFACVVGSLRTCLELFLRMFTNTLWWKAFGATVA